MAGNKEKKIKRDKDKCVISREMRRDGGVNFTFAKVSLCTFGSTLPRRLQRCLLFVFGLGGIGGADETPPGSLRCTAPPDASESSR